MSTAALSRNPSRTIPGLSMVAALGNSIWTLIARRVRAGKDERTLQTLPDHVLADMGLSRIEMPSSAGGRHVWVIPHRYY